MFNHLMIAAALLVGTISASGCDQVVMQPEVQPSRIRISAGQPVNSSDITVLQDSETGREYLVVWTTNGVGICLMAKFGEHDED